MRPLGLRARSPGEPAHGSRVATTEFAGIGCVVQLAGVLFVLGWPIGSVVGLEDESAMAFGLVTLLGGILLLAIGSRMARIERCSECRSKLPEKGAMQCAHCGARFE